MTAPHVLPQVDLKGRRHLLDLGGGPGTYAIHFCQSYPNLKATIYDMPTTRPYAEKTVARFGLTDRIDFQAGNYIEDPIKGTFDVAWLSHVLHSEGPETCRGFIAKTIAVLEKGGQIYIHDFILDDSMDAPLFPALFSLNMLLRTTSGQSYSETHIIQMLKDCGVTGIRRLPFKGPQDSGIVTGTV